MGGWGWVGDLSHCDSSPVTAAGLPNITPQPPFQHLLSSFEQSSTSFSKSFSVLYSPLFRRQTGDHEGWPEVGWGWLEWIHLHWRAITYSNFAKPFFEVSHVELQTDTFDILALSFHVSWNSICSVACLEVRQWNFIGGAAAYAANTWNTWTVQPLIAQHRMLFTLAPQHCWFQHWWTLEMTVNDISSPTTSSANKYFALPCLASQFSFAGMSETVEWPKHLTGQNTLNVLLKGLVARQMTWSGGRPTNNSPTWTPTNKLTTTPAPAWVDHIIRKTLSRVIIITHNPHPNRVAQLKNYETDLRSLSGSINSAYKISGKVLAVRKMTTFGKIKMMKMLMMTHGLTLCPAGGSLNVWTLNTLCWLSQM